MNFIIYPKTNFKKLELLNIDRGEGIYLYDDAGNHYLEGLAGLWCSALDFGHRELIDAITEQLETLSYLHSFGGRTNPVAMELANKLTVMVPIESAKVFFANSGSEANDSHMKMLRYYHNVMGKPEKKRVIALERSYHGVTMASAALTTNHTHFNIPLDAVGILRADSPHYYRGRLAGEIEEEFIQQDQWVNSQLINFSRFMPVISSNSCPQ